MYVKRIFTDNWAGARSKDAEYECKKMEQIIAAIKGLNGRNKTMVLLKSNEDRTLTVAGGNDGRYIAYLTVGTDDEFYNLIDSTQPEKVMLNVVAGGQSGAYSAKQCIRIETAIEAARQFAVDGGMSGSLEWEKQV